MKLFNSILFAALSSALISTAHAQSSTAPSTECVPKSEMQTIAQHFTQFADLAKADYCNDESPNWYLVSSIMYMRKTQFSPNMPVSKDELFTGRFANDWYGYFIGRINDLSIVNDCPKGVIAYVYMFGNTMYVCPAALTKSFSSLDRASVMMHEARHIDGFPHITCSKGARQGLQGACDTKIADGGSYAVTVETYAQLAKYAEGIHPAMRAYAKSSAVIYADEAFENQVKISRSEKLVLLTSGLDFHSMDVSTGSLKQLGKASAPGKIVKRGQHMIIFPTDKTLKAQYVFANNEGEISQSPSDFITEYNAGTPDQKANLVDLHIGAQWSARVYKNKVTFVCDPRSPATTDIALPAGQTAANLVYPNGYAREVYTAQLAPESGDTFDLSCANKQASLKPSALRLDQKYSRVYKANGQVFGVAQGRLFKIEGQRSTPVQTAVDGQIIEIVPVQSFDFFDSSAGVSKQ